MYADNDNSAIFGFAVPLKPESAEPIHPVDLQFRDRLIAAPLKLDYVGHYTLNRGNSAIFGSRSH